MKHKEDLLETIFKVHFRGCRGEHLRLRHDPDGLGMIEFCWFGDDGTPATPTNIQPEQVPALIEALTKLRDLLNEGGDM